MNTQQYYRLAANTALNGSFAALIPVLIFIIPLYLLMPKKEMVLLALPFLFISFFSYQSFLIHKERAMKSESAPKMEPVGSVFQERKMLMTFLPAPSLRMLLFQPNGHVYGEIRDTKFSKFRWLLPPFLDKRIFSELGLYDHNNNLLVAFKWAGKKGAAMNAEGRPFIMLNEKIKNHYEVMTENGSFAIHTHSHSMFTDTRFISEKEIIARVRKGLMPLQWGKSFVDANTPVLSLHEDLTKEQTVAIVAILAKMYQYYDH